MVHSSSLFAKRPLLWLALFYMFLPSINHERGLLLTALGSLFWASLANKTGNIRGIILITGLVSFVLEYAVKLVGLFFLPNFMSFESVLTRKVYDDIMMMICSAPIVLLDSFTLQHIEDNGLDYSVFVASNFFTEILPNNLGAQRSPYYFSSIMTEITIAVYRLVFISLVGLVFLKRFN